MGWLNSHLEEFVAPVLGYIPEYDEEHRYFTQDELAIIKNCWKSVKAASKKRTILLPGRDVFIFEVLARRENYPTLFLPQCSRLTVNSMLDKQFRSMLLLDTGFIGSIPKKLGLSNFLLISQSGQQQYNINSRQVFPRMTGSRGLALKIERTPKYWNTARILDGKIHQELNDKVEFRNAALLTIEIYKNSVPKSLVTTKRYRKGGYSYGQGNQWF